MRRSSLALAIAVVATSAHADDPPPDASGPPGGDPIAEIRALFAIRDYAAAREKLLQAYARAPAPPLLFALGQAEFNLRHWEAAIHAYEGFIATDPPADQAALAQQGIGAARIEMQREAERPPPPPPPEPRRRAWHTSDTILVASGGAAVAGGAALFGYGRHVGNDRSGSLAAYDERTDRARALQWAATGLAAAGVIAAGVAVLRWRLRPDDGEVSVTTTGVTVSFAW